MAREQVNLPEGMTPASIEAALMYLRAQTQENADRPTGILQPNQIRGVKKGYQYEYREYPKALNPPMVEIKSAADEQKFRRKWNRPLPWDPRDPIQQEYISEYYAAQADRYPYFEQPPQVIAKDADDEAMILAKWQSEHPDMPGLRKYPAWMHHPSKSSVMVVNHKAEQDLGPGWYPTIEEAVQVAKGIKSATPTKEEADRNALLEIAEELGVKIDARERTPTIRSRVKAAQEKAEGKPATTDMEI